MNRACKILLLAIITLAFAQMAPAAQLKQGGCGRQWPGNYNVRSPERIDPGVRQGQIKPGKSGPKESCG